MTRNKRNKKQEKTKTVTQIRKKRWCCILAWYVEINK